VRAPLTMTERDMLPPVPGRRRWQPCRVQISGLEKLS
jgi:hypothetical protein